MDGEVGGPLSEREMILFSNNMLYMGFCAGYSKRHKLLPMLVQCCRPRICLFGALDGSGCFGRISATFVSLVSLDCAKETTHTLSDLVGMVSINSNWQRQGHIPLRTACIPCQRTRARRRKMSSQGNLEQVSIERKQSPRGFANQ